jgi:phage terminase Nu1 subunit (DNA packaging protein)
MTESLDKESKELQESHINFIMNKINKLEERVHTHLFEIIKKYECKYTENDNGVFIRLNQLSLECIWEVYQYISDISEEESDMFKENSQDEYDDEEIQREDAANKSLIEKEHLAEERKTPQEEVIKENKSKKRAKKKCEDKKSTQMFLNNNIEIDDWKKEIIMKLKSKSKK